MSKDPHRIKQKTRHAPQTTLLLGAALSGGNAMALASSLVKSSKISKENKEKLEEAVDYIVSQVSP